MASAQSKKSAIKTSTRAFLFLQPLTATKISYRAIQAGAKGYLLKDVPREALMDSIRRVNAGETCVPVHLAAKLAERVSGETLSSREVDVLKLMAQGKSNKEIGAALFISEGTVKSHVKAIFAKMNVISRTEAVASATRRGLIQL